MNGGRRCRWFVLGCLLFHLSTSGETAWATAAKRVYLLVGSISNIDSRSLDGMPMLLTRLRIRGYEPIVNFAATESVVSDAFRDSNALGILWIGHSGAPSNLLVGADGRLISPQAFSEKSETLTTFVIGTCCAKQVIDRYEFKTKYPELSTFYLPGNERGIVDGLDLGNSLFKDERTCLTLFENFGSPSSPALYRH